MSRRLLVVSQYWTPAQLAGGARSTGRAIAALAGTTDTWVVTGDRDVGDTEAWTDLPHPSAAPRSGTPWTVLDGVSIWYQPWDRGAGRRVRRAVDEVAPDVIYLPSLFAPGSLAVLWRRAVGGVRVPIVVAPEGELHPGALAHHPGRKRAVVALVRWSRLATRVRWRAVDDLEAAHIRTAVGSGAVVTVAPDLHEPPIEVPPTTGSKAPGRARVAFVGTIVPKKGLHRALELLWPTRHQVDLDIYGPPVDPDEWARCRALLDRCEDDVRWEVHGAVPHADVGPALAAADLCILPTLGENYGYVIAEALAAGCPVLVSDQTPWRGLAADGCGWDLPLEPAHAWQARIAEVVAWDDDERRRARDAARRRAERARAESASASGAWLDLIADAASPHR